MVDWQDFGGKEDDQPKIEDTVGIPRIPHSVDWQSHGGVATKGSIEWEKFDGRKSHTFEDLKKFAETTRVPFREVGKSALELAEAVTGFPVKQELSKNFPGTVGVFEGMAQTMEIPYTPENFTLAATSLLKVPTLAHKIASGAFGAMMARQIPEIGRKAQEAYARGDTRAATRIATLGIGQTIFALLGLREGFGEGVADVTKSLSGGDFFSFLRDVPTSIRERAGTPEEAAIYKGITPPEPTTTDFAAQVLGHVPTREPPVLTPEQKPPLPMGDIELERFKKVMEEKFGPIVKPGTPFELGVPEELAYTTKLGVWKLKPTDKWPPVAGAVLNPLDVVSSLMKIAQDSIGFGDFMQRVGENKDFMDTVKAYKLDLKSLWDKRQDKETRDSINSVGESLNPKPKVSAEDEEMLWERGMENLVETHSDSNDSLAPWLKESRDFIGGVAEFIQKSKETIPMANSIQRNLDALKTQSLADEIRAGMVAKDARLSRYDYTEMYHHAENSKEILNPEQETAMSNEITPLARERERIFMKLRGAGVPIPQDQYTPRFPIGKGNIFDRLVSGVKTGMTSGLLRTASSSFKHRVFKALTGDSGDRVVAAIKGDQVTAFRNKNPQFMGGLNLKRYEDLLEKELEPLKNQRRKLETELRILTATEGRQAASPVRIENITTSLEELERKEQAITDRYNLPELNKKVFVDKSSKRWTIGEATSKEITKESGQRYHTHLLLNELVKFVELRKTERAVDFLESLKSSPEFLKGAMKWGSGEIPGKWRSTDLPQFRGWAMEPRWAEVFDMAYKDMKAGGDLKGIFTKLNDFMRVAIFYPPFLHVHNIVGHWAAARGKAWMTASGYSNMWKYGGRAIQSVLTQDNDYVDLLDHSANLLYYRSTGERFVDILYKKMGTEMERDSSLKGKISDTLGLPVDLVKAIYKFSNMVTWFTNDVAMLEHIFELEDKGKTRIEAVEEASKHIPDYRKVARVLGSTELSEIMFNQNITMFGRYHYGALKSYGEMIKDMYKNSPPGARVEAFDKAAVIGLGYVAMYPVLDAIAQAITGDERYIFRRAGPWTFPYNTYKLATGKMDVAEYIQAVLTPAVGLRAIMEVVQNKEWHSGRRIIRSGHVSKGAGEILVRSLAPLDKVRAMDEGNLEPSEFIYNLLGMYKTRH